MEKSREEREASRKFFPMEIKARQASGIYDICYDKGKNPILLIGATLVELEKIGESLQDTEEYIIGAWHYIAGNYHGKPVVLGKTEWGMENSAAATALGIEAFHPAAVINLGTCGGYAPELHVYDIILGERTMNSATWKSDFEARGSGVDYKKISMDGTFTYNKKEKKFTRDTYHLGDAGLLQAAQSVSDRYARGKVVKGVLSSSDGWNNQLDRIAFLHEKYGALSEDMESDSVAQICQNYDIPFLAIRVVSNTIVHQEDLNLETAAACQKFVLDIIDVYEK